MDIQQQIDSFLAGAPHAVIGASTNREKYGNKVLRAYLQRERAAYPINPRATEIEGVTAYAQLADLPEPVHGISIITPPAITEQVVTEALGLKIPHIWMQPGSESDSAIAAARAAGVNVIAHGPCLLVALRFRESSDGK